MDVKRVASGDGTVVLIYRRKLLKIWAWRVALLEALALAAILFLAVWGAEQLHVALVTGGLTH